MLRKFTMLFAAAALAATLAFAQTTMMGTAPTPPAPATMATLYVNQLAAQLALTDAEKASAITIYTNAYTAGQPIQTNLQTDQQSLATAVKANAIGTIDSLASTMGALQGQLTKINSEAEAAFYALLSAAQQKLYDAMPHGGPGGGRGPGGRGGPGGPGGMMGNGMRGNGMRGGPAVQ